MDGQMDGWMDGATEIIYYVACVDCLLNHCSGTVESWGITFLFSVTQEGTVLM